MNCISFDIETFSSVDLAKAGVYRYAEAPDFRVLLFGCSVDGGPVHVYDLASGEKLPAEILSALTDGMVLKCAFNASFERVCLSRYLRDLGLLPPGEFLSPAGWHCTMVRCMYLGLPHSLAQAGEVLGLDKQKLTEGKELIRFFCLPAKPSLVNGRSDRNGPAADPDRWQQFMEYNRRDVEAEMQIQERLKSHPVPESVWREYELDQEINDRGIRVDERLVSTAFVMDEISREELTAELSRLTQLSNPNSVSQIRQWLTDRGSEMESLGKKEVAAMLRDADPKIREVLLLRQQLAKSSVKKYEAMRNSACADGRVRGMFQFYGASRSGRWAGRGVQLQNLPQNHLPDLDQARDTVLAGDYGVVKALYDSVPDVLSELIRTAFVPAEGKKFIVADFSAVEARVIAWLAGESWRLDVFASGGDIYCASAEQMFHVPVVKHGVNGHLRQKGKIAELALGYGGSVGALKAMGALEMGVPEDELQPLVTAWRNANPKICRLWRKVDKAVKDVVRTRGTVKLPIGAGSFAVNNSTLHSQLSTLDISFHSGMLFIRLPSGRSLVYVRPRLGLNRFGSESVLYQGLNAATKWDLIESYGPKFVENIVQGISRDLLAEAMMRLSASSALYTNGPKGSVLSASNTCGPKGSRGRSESPLAYRIVAHVHDEVIIEADPEDSVEEVCRIMGECPSWANGLILRADGYECKTYRKD